MLLLDCYISETRLAQLDLFCFEREDQTQANEQEEHHVKEQAHVDVCKRVAYVSVHIRI